MSNELNEILYIETKEKAYKLAAVLSKEEILNNLKNNIYIDDELKIIYQNTLMFPNDKEIFIEIKNLSDEKRGINYKDLEEVGKNLGIPISVLNQKIIEFKKYNFQSCVEKSDIMKKYSEQMSQFEYDKKTIL